MYLFKNVVTLLYTLSKIKSEILLGEMILFIRKHRIISSLNEVEMQDNFFFF